MMWCGMNLTCMSLLGVSNSFTLPSSSTRILSESKMLCKRCAMVSTVQSAKAARTVSCMRASLAVSTLLVASSRTSTLALRRRARAIHSSCLCPELRLLPASPSTASKPPYAMQAFAINSRCCWTVLLCVCLVWEVAVTCRRRLLGRSCQQSCCMSWCRAEAEYCLCTWNICLS